MAARINRRLEGPRRIKGKRSEKIGRGTEAYIKKISNGGKDRMKRSSKTWSCATS